MPHFAANLSMMYTQLPFLQRFAAAAQDGFEGVEFLFPYDWPAAQIADLLQQHKLQQVLFNAPPGEQELYHCQTMEGDVTTRLRHYLPGAGSATCRSPACRSAKSLTWAS